MSGSCVNSHKKELECDGKRDRVAYVSLKQMNTGNLVSDIRFLEEIEASSGGAKRHLATFKSLQNPYFIKLIRNSSTLIPFLIAVAPNTALAHETTMFKSAPTYTFENYLFVCENGGASDEDLNM